MMHGTIHVGVHISLTPITRDSIEEYSNTTCIHCNDMYFDLWNLKNTQEKSEKNLKTIFEKKCGKCIDAEEIRQIVPVFDTAKPEINIERLERNCPPGWSHLWR